MRLTGPVGRSSHAGQLSIVLQLLLLWPMLQLPSTASAASAGLKRLLPPVDPESKLYARMAGLIVPCGYPLEEHFVETVSQQQLPCCCDYFVSTRIMQNTTVVYYQLESFKAGG